VRPTGPDSGSEGMMVVSKRGVNLRNNEPIGAETGPGTNVRTEPNEGGRASLDQLAPFIGSDLLFVKVEKRKIA